MGIPFSLLGKLGFPGVQSLSTDQVFNNYFKKDNIQNFNQFHAAFLKVCSDLNTILPGRHFIPPPRKEIVNFYELRWKTLEDDQKKQAAFSEFMQANITENKGNDGAIVLTGLVAPPAAMMLKRSGENLPQLKRFRLNLIPDIVFVPSVTLLAVLGVKVLQINMSSKNKPADL